VNCNKSHKTSSWKQKYVRLEVFKERESLNLSSSFEDLDEIRMVQASYDGDWA
jgi:hypothetical protein